MMLKTAFANNFKAKLSTFGNKVSTVAGNVGNTIQNQWQTKAKPFLHDLKGQEVRDLDNQIKGVTHNANQVGHEAYTAASKKFRGWNVVPGHESYRMKQVFANPEYSDLADRMTKLQEERKAYSQRTNRARVKAGVAVAGTAALIGGGIALKKYHDKKKAEKEEEEYYKTASFKDTIKGIPSATKNAVKSAKKAAKATGIQIKHNFAHAPETDYLYGQGKKQALKDIATFKRIRELNGVLSYGAGGEYSEIPSDEYKKLNRYIRSFNKADAESKRLTKAIESQKKRVRHRTDLDSLVEQSEKAFTDSGERTNPRNNRPVGYNKRKDSQGRSYDRNSINKNIKQMSDAKDKFKNDADAVLSHIDDTFSNIKKTRNNELAKSIALYAVPAAALTLGGAYIYKRRKKAKQKEKSENKTLETNNK